MPRLPVAFIRSLIFAVFIAGGAVLPAQAAAPDACRNDEVTLRGPFGTVRFSVEIADDAQERARGLMFRESLPASSGMLFVYDAPGDQRFWMKNTLIPLDMLFITPEGRVQFIRHMAAPGDLTAISGGPGVQYVLEIKGGLARALGIAPGAEMRHPALDQTRALWPCAGEK